MENMTRLVYLNLSGSKQLEELPGHITNQASLTELVCDIEKLKELPVNIGQLRKLRSLRISSESLTSLPTSIGDLSSLNHLEISGCLKLECLPTSIGDLSSLTYHRIDGCPKLECLPESFGQLINLQELSIIRCPISEMQSFGQLINLQHLWISGCPISEMHIEAGLFTCLKGISLLLTDVAKISICTDLPQLEWLTIEDNRHLKEIDGVLPNTLQRLRLKSCPKLEVLPSFAQLASLKYLTITGCRKVECLPESLTRLHLLQSLYLEDVGLKSLPKSFGQLINLQYLKISGCPISELHIEAGLFTCLKWISLWSTDVAKISICTDLPQLEWLEIVGNRHLKEIDGVLPNTLQRLRLEKCPNLEVLPSFARLASLQGLKIVGCYGVKKIAGLEHCGGLRKVELQTMRGSGFEGFIKSIKKSPREGIAVCSRAVDDAATILNFFAFPSLSLIHSFANQKAELSFELPYTAPCILLCFVLNCRSPKTTLKMRVSRNDIGNGMELEEGKWVWTALLTEEHDSVGNLVSEELSVGNLVSGCEGDVEVEVEKGVVFIGKEGSAWDAFNQLCLALPN